MRRFLFICLAALLAFAQVVSAGPLAVSRGGAGGGGGGHTDNAGPSGAASITVTLDNAATNEDGGAVGTVAWTKVIYTTTSPTNTDPVGTQFTYWKWVSGTQTSVTITGLQAGLTWYVAVQIEDSNGNLSRQSQFVQKST